MKQINIVEADYIQDFKLLLKFSDGTFQKVDFGKFLEKHSHPQFNKYKDLDNFKSYKLEMGNIVWGEN
jgi:Protein of unknown function (DUF2442)